MSGSKRINLPDHGGDTFEVRQRNDREGGADDAAEDDFELLANAHKVRAQDLEFEDEDFEDGGEAEEEYEDGPGGGGGALEPRPEEFGMDADVVQSAAKIRAEKLKLLSKLNDLAARGVPVPADASLRTNIEELRHHVETIERGINLKASIRFQKRLLVAAVSGLEFANNKYKSKTNLELDGWSSQVYSQLDDYNSVMERYVPEACRGSSFPPLAFSVGGGGTRPARRPPRSLRGPEGPPRS